MNLMHYLLEANLYLVAFYAVYLLLLRSETHYQLSRAYLLITSALAFVIPFLQLGILKPVTHMVPEANITIGSSDVFVSVIQPTHIAAAAPKWTMDDYLLLAYGMVALVLLVNLVIRIYLLVSLSKKGSVSKNDGFKVIELQQGSIAFSFFNNLFIDDRLSSSKTILHHEQVHIRQKHSWDIIYLELLKIVNWFNPAVYLLTASVKELHEFIADRETASLENSNDTYTEFLISNAYGITQNSLTNSFFNKNLLKRRIIMLYQKRSGKAARLKYLLVLPLMGGALCLSTMAFTNKNYGWVDIMPKTERADMKPATQNNTALDLKDLHGPAANDTSAYTRGWHQAEHDMKTMPLIVINDNISMIMPPPDFDWAKAGNEDYARLLHVDVNTIKTVNKLTAPKTAAKYGRKAPNGALEITTFHHIVRFPPPVVRPEAVPNTDEPIYNAVEIGPEFPGGISEFGEFLRKNIRYPKEAHDAGKQGRAFIQFVVETEGSLSGIKVLRDPGYGMGDEALRVMKLSPKWKPGVQKGKKVRVIYTVPVNFSLANDGGKVPQQLRPTDNPVGGVQIPDKTFGTFPGGNEGFSKFLRENVTYPKEAKEKNVSGRVFLQFMIEKDGSLTDLKVLRDPGTGLGDEAIRVMKLSPNWNPGMKDGEAVRTQYTVPINFALDNNGSGDFNMFYYYVKTQIRYPADAKDKDIAGRVFIQFTIDNNHGIQNVKCLRSPTQSLQDEAIRVVSAAKSIGVAKPGATYILPVMFNISHSKDVELLPPPKPDDKNYKPLDGKISLNLNEVIVTTYK